MNRISRFVTYATLTVLVVVGCGSMISAGSATDREVSLGDAGRPVVERFRPSPASFGLRVEQAPTQIDPTTVEQVQFDVLFDRAIDPWSFTYGDIVQVGSATVGSWSIVDSGDRMRFYLSASVMTDGTVIPTIPAGVVEDGGGNTNQVSTSTDNSVTFGAAVCNTQTFLYVAIWSPAKIRAYCVESDGSLSFQSEVNAPGDAREMQISANGNSLFYAHSDLARYTLSQDGSLVLSWTREVGNGSFDDLVLDPAGRYLYGTHSRNGGRVYVYDVTRDSMPEIQVVTGFFIPHGLTIDPEGQNIFVANYSPEEIYSYPLLADGTLDESQQQSTDWVSRPMYFAMHPVLNRLYWTEAVGGFVFAGTRSGAHVELWDHEISGRGARAITITDDGEYIFVANNNDDDISTFSIAPTGGLIPRWLAPTARRPEHLHLHPSGEFLYVASAGDDGGPSTISIYQVLDDGSLSAKTPVVIADQGAYRLAIVDLSPVF